MQMLVISMQVPPTITGHVNTHLSFWTVMETALLILITTVFATHLIRRDAPTQVLAIGIPIQRLTMEVVFSLVVVTLLLVITMPPQVAAMGPASSLDVQYHLPAIMTPMLYATTSWYVLVNQALPVMMEIR
jgi:hypothetical protein